MTRFTVKMKICQENYERLLMNHFLPGFKLNKMAEGVADSLSENAEEFGDGMDKAMNLLEEGKQPDIRSACIV